MVFLSCIHISSLVDGKEVLDNDNEDEHLDVRNMSKTLLVNWNINVTSVQFCWFLLQCTVQKYEKKNLYTIQIFKHDRQPSKWTGHCRACPCILYIYICSFIHSVINSFIHLVFCLTTGPKPLPKRALQIVQSRASSFKWEYPLLSLRLCRSFIRLLPRLLVTSVPLLSFLQ